MNVGSLNLDLSVTLSKFHAALNEAVSRISELGTEMERSFGTKPQKEIQKTQDRLSKFTWAARGYIKDTSKIITGILISQSFYQLLNTIETAIGSLFEFNMQLQEAAVSFELLLGNKERAQGFLAVLEDFTATTPLIYEQSLKIAALLRAMGFQAQSIIPIMRTIVDAATVRGGGADVIEGIARALGQILTKGKVEYEELMQLAERGIPVFEILREELGLTADQIDKIGKQGIPAGAAINAILTGMQKRFGGAAQKINRTTRGLLSNIHDNLMFLGNQVFAPVFDLIRGRLEALSDRLQQLRAIARERGLGGLFQALIPPRLQGTIKSILASFWGLYDAIKTLREALKPITDAIGEVLLRTLGVVLPIITTFARVLAHMARWLTSNIPLVRYLAGAIATLVIAGTVITLLNRLTAAIKALAIAEGVAKAVMALKRAIQALHMAMVKDPITGLIMLAAAALIGLALSSKTASRWLDQVMQKLGLLLGFDIDKALEPADPVDISKWMKEYNKSLREVGNQLGGTGDEAAKAGKKVEDKFLAAFDEVYEIPDKMDDAGLGDIGGGIPAIPDIGLVDTDKFINKDKLEETGGSLWDWFKDKWEELKKALQDQVNKDRLIIPPPIFTPWPPNPAYAFAEELAAALEKIRKAYEAAKEWLERIKEMLQQIVAPLALAYRSVVEALKAILEALKNAYEAAKEWVRRFNEALRGLGAPLVQAYQAVREVLQNLRELIASKIADMVAALAQLPAAAKALFEEFKQKVSETLSSVANFFKEHQGLIVGILGAIVLAVGAFLLGLPGTVAAGAVAFVLAIATMFTNAKIAAAETLDKTKTEVTNKWEAIKTNIDAKLSEIWTVITTKWEEIKTSISTKLEEIWTAVTTKWEAIKADTLNIVQGFVTGILGKWNDLKVGLDRAYESIKRAASEHWDGIKELIRGKINYIIELVNKFTRAISNIKIHVPKIRIPYVGTVGGWTVDFPDIPPIPLLDTGGIVTRDTLARLAGNNRPEAVIPLTSEAARPFAEMIADAIASIIPEPLPASTPSLPPIYVGTLIGDERSLRELTRRIEVIRIQEVQRKGGRG